MTTSSTTRRELLRLGLGSASLLACGTSVPSFLARSAQAMAAEKPASHGRILVVVQLDGGNDGLNTVVPFADDAYHRHRPRLALAEHDLIAIDDHVGFHPALGDFARLLDDGQLAVVQSVGYPNPNRSHFTSMAIWQTARLAPTLDTPGWLAHWLDRTAPAEGADPPALHVEASALPQALAGSRRFVPTVDRLDQLRRRLSGPDSSDPTAQRAALDAIAAHRRDAAASPLLPFLQRSLLTTYASSARLEGILDERSPSPPYPESFALARRLKRIAQLIRAGLSTAIYYTQLGGFDTHANQLASHANLLRELGASLKAFLDDLEQSGDAERVVVLVFSEFGRRLTENASAGTDHGTAAPVFVLGRAVAAGLHGPYPNLTDLADGDPQHALDFRALYATLIDGWLNGSSRAILGESFAGLPLLR